MAWSRREALFEGCAVNSESYLEMLTIYFISQLEQLELIEVTVFYQGGTPCRFALHF